MQTIRFIFIFLSVLIVSGFSNRILAESSIFLSGHDYPYPYHVDTLVKVQPNTLENASPGQVITMDGKKITVIEMDITPVIENTYSKRGVYEHADNPKLQQLRKQEDFDKLITGLKNEFDQQVLILDWAQRRLPKFGSPTSNVTAPLDIIKAADEGNTFFCNHYACIFVGAAASMGWVCRTLALHVGNEPSGSGAPEHSVAEIWS